jgi:ribonuclease BN (tRNA processing enzyme)
MRLTVLGKSPSWQDAGGACSGYLLQDDETTVLLDCGNGIFGKLRQFVDYVDVHAVVLSHLHADHFLDLIPYSYALTYAPRQQPVPVPPWPGTDSPARPRLIAPPGAKGVFRRITGCFGSEELIEKAFAVEEYRPDDSPEVGPFRFTFHEVPHFTQTFAVKVTSNGGTLVFGADSSPTSELVDFARGCDLLLVEATLPRPERSGIRGHLTPEEAGEHGKSAGAKRRVITHISDELDLVWARRQASEAFGSRAELAREGAVFEV